MYASASAVQVDGALCNCRNLAPLYAGLVGEPVAGIGVALIGGLFRYFVYGGASALPCMLACFLAGIFMDAKYVRQVEDSLKKIDKNLVDISIPRERGTAPTQAFSEFLSSKCSSANAAISPFN